MKYHFQTSRSSTAEVVALLLTLLDCFLCVLVISSQSWALSVFLRFFNNKKLFVCNFYKVNVTGSGLFKKDWCRNSLLSNAKNSFFISEKFPKYRKCPALVTVILARRPVAEPPRPIILHFVLEGDARRMVCRTLVPAHTLCVPLMSPFTVREEK